MQASSSPTPSNQGPQSSVSEKGHADLKRETIKIPLPKITSGGNLPPVPPIVKHVATMPDPDEGPKRDKKIGSPSSAAPIRIPAAPRMGIVPGGKTPVLETKRAESTTPPVSQIDSWLKVTAIGAGAFAVSSLCYTAELVWNLSHGSTAGNVVAGIGILAVLKLSFGEFPRLARVRR